MGENLPLLPNYTKKANDNVFTEKDNTTIKDIGSQNEKWNILVGSLSMIVAALCFGLSSFFIRVCEKNYNMPSNVSFFIVFFISWISLFPYICFNTGLSKVVNLTKNQYFFIFLRASFGTASGLLFVYAVNLAPIGDAAAAYNVCPSVTLILAAIFLKERIRKIDIFSLVLSSLGVFLITRSDSSSTAVSSHHLLGTILSALSGAMAACAYITIRHLKTHIHFMTPPFFFFPFAALTGIVIGGVPSLNALTSYSYGTLFAILSGLFSGYAQVFLSIGLQKCPAGRAIIIRNLEIPFEYTMGLMFLHELINSRKIFAALLIICSTIMLGIRKPSK